MTRIRTYNDQDYDLVKGWWEGHGIAPMPKPVLNTVGYISSENSKDIAAAWVYMDDHCKVAWANLFISNPDAGSKQIYQAHQDIIECFTRFLEDQGFWILMAFYDRKSLANLAKRSGFHVNHEGVYEMFKILTPRKEVA